MFQRTERVATVDAFIHLVGAVLVALVTDWSVLAVGVLQVVAALPLQAVHHGVPLTVVPTQDVVRLGGGV